LAKQARATSLDTILAGLDVLSTTKARLKFSNHGRTLAEMALVRLGRLGELQSLPQLAHWLGQLRFDGATSGPRIAPPEGVKKKPPTLSLPSRAAVPELPGLLELTDETMPDIWERVLGMLGPLLAEDLRKANLPAIFGPNTLAIRFPEAYNTSRDSCQMPGNVTRIEDALKKVTGRPWTLRIEATPTTVVVSSASRVPAPEAPPAVRPARRNPRDEAEKEPLVKYALDKLSAQIAQPPPEGFGTKPPEGAKPSVAVVPEEGDTSDV
jgi:DNA polymerase-3 subunit gamma/tau